MKIAINAKNIDSAWLDKVEFLLGSLSKKGAELCYFKDFYEQIKSELDTPQGEIFDSYESFPENVDILLALGGDGTFLSSLTFIRERNIPIAGINFGRLGFLTTIKVSDDDNSWIDDIVSKRYLVEERSLICLESPLLPASIYPYALNDISIHRVQNSMLTINLSIDGLDAPIYWSDGLLVATPTGSTAYSLSVGGPIVTPDSNVLIIAPIAPHNLNVRPLVVPENSTIELSFMAREGEAFLTIDNQTIALASGSELVIRLADFKLNYISLGGNTFMGALREKLMWGEDRRNNN